MSELGGCQHAGKLGNPCSGATLPAGGVRIWSEAVGVAVRQDHMLGLQESMLAAFALQCGVLAACNHDQVFSQKGVSVQAVVICTKASMARCGSCAGLLSCHLRPR